ncbi:MAG: hypothetical protein ABW352_22880 [Polyangiales bacterium]
MTLRYSLFAFSFVALVTGCSSSDTGGKKAASTCDEDEVGQDCTCDDDAEGKYECNDDALECICEPAVEEDDDPPPTTKRDASTAKPDASKPTAKPDASKPVIDAGAPPEEEEDAGDDMPPVDVPTDKPDPSKLPKVSGTCPDLKDGTITIAGAKVQIWVGSKPGPVYLYFHGTGTAPSEINQGIPGASSSVKTEGGIAASWDTSNNKGTNTGTIWYTGDMEAADQIIACGIEKGIVDTARIHVSGYSAGGLETGAFVAERAHYVASVIVYSGGKPFGVRTPVGSGGNAPAMVGAHGAPGSDSLGIDFGSATPALGAEIVKAGGFAIDCNDGGGHIALSRLGLGGKARDFFKAHSWKAKPWTAVPSGWPSNCKTQ